VKLANLIIMTNALHEIGGRLDYYRKIAVTVGLLFITATVVTILSLPLIGSILESVDDPDYFVNVSADEHLIVAGALLFLVCAVAVLLIPVVMFPILKKYSEALALGYFGFRIIEAITIVATIVSWLLLITLSNDYVESGAPDASYYQTTGTMLTESGIWIGYMLSLFLSMGSLVFFYLLHQLRLVPRFISVWGLAGGFLHLVGTVGLMFGSFEDDSALGMLTVLPLALVEMVLAGWLIVKGFNPSAIADLSGEDAKTAT
jgi:hypothetical protein